MRTIPRFGRILASACAAIVVCVFATRAEGGSLPSATLPIGGGSIEVNFGDGDFDLPREVLLDHIAQAACAVSTYYGHFPVPHYRLLIVPVADRRGVLTGTTWGFGGAHTRIFLGQHTNKDDLINDWVMTHEMVHTAFPTMSEEHHWIEEGIATYVEPLVRSWIGTYPPQKVWADLVIGLPKGLPGWFDEGLDRTATWARTYWGGAMFCALADIEIRRRTATKRGLIDALRAILAASGGIETEWSADRAFKTGDAAVGVPVLEELYAKMKSTPTTPDLGAIWKRIGVEMKDGDAILDDSAPEAAIRRSISARPAEAPEGCSQWSACSKASKWLSYTKSSTS